MPLHYPPAGGAGYCARGGGTNLEGAGTLGGGGAAGTCVTMRTRKLPILLAAALFAAGTASHAATPEIAVGPQYDTTHVYVAPQDFDRFVTSLVATFGGTTTKQGVFTVTPTQSSTMSQLVLTPVGSVSVFGFKTPIPYPFGLERTGYLVTDLNV